MKKNVLTVKLENVFNPLWIQDLIWYKNESRDSKNQRSEVWCYGWYESLCTVVIYLFTYTFLCPSSRPRAWAKH